MRKLKIGFSRNRHDRIFSVILQKYMNRDYSHVFVEYETEDKLGDNAIYHSSLSSGVGFMSRSVFEEDNIVTHMYEIELSEELYIKVRKELFSVCGKKYGLLQNIGIAIVDSFRYFGIKVNNPFINGQNCSELLYRHFINVVYPEYKYDPDIISPKDIEDIMKQVAIKVI